LFIAISFLPLGVNAKPLDPKTGNIGERIAIAALPLDPQRSNHAPCEVHLVLTTYDKNELLYPCNTWFQPPVGRYLFWLEQGSSISYQSVIFYSGEAFHRAGMLLSKPLFPAGKVEIQGERIPSGATLRVLSLRTARNYRPFDRVIKPVGATYTFRIPAGRIIAGVFDAAGNALSLSAPHVVQGGHIERVALRSARTTATLLVILDRFVSRLPLPPCAASLTIGNRRQSRPTVDLQAHDRVVLVWYDLDAGDARLDFRCRSGQTFTRTQHLREGRVATIRTRLAYRVSR
jgi:hypothetical protein